MNLRQKTTKEKRKKRAKAGNYGTSSRPRLAVFRSNKYIYAQLIDDESAETLVTVDDITREVHEGKTKKKAAYELGEMLAERAREAGIKKVVFDKGPYKYHGRVKSLAEGAREGGLVF
jgi:large subunit ribosomal protein L18